MKFWRKFPKLNQRGFTGLELLIALIIGSIVTVAAVTAIHLIWTNNMRCITRVTAIKQVENALHFISRDVQMAQVIETDNLPAGDLLRLTWLNWDNATRQVTYSLNDGNLVRTDDLSSVQTSVARAITSLNIVSGMANQVTITINCTVTEPQPASETRILEILPRYLH